MAKRKPQPSPAGGGLRDAVLTLATAGRRGIAAWHQRLPADVLDELRQIRRDAGEITGNAAVGLYTENLAVKADAHCHVSGSVAELAPILSR